MLKLNWLPDLTGVEILGAAGGIEVTDAVLVVIRLVTSSCAVTLLIIP